MAVDLNLNKSMKDVERWMVKLFGKENKKFENLHDAIKEVRDTHELDWYDTNILMVLHESLPAIKARNSLKAKLSAVNVHVPEYNDDPRGYHEFLTELSVHSEIGDIKKAKKLGKRYLKTDEKSVFSLKNILFVLFVIFLVVLFIVGVDYLPKHVWIHPTMSESEQE